MVASIIGYGLLLLAITWLPAGPTAIGALVLSRLPIGLAKQTITVSRALLCDCTRDDVRLRTMGTLGVTVGFGFIVGPGLGGALSMAVSPHAPVQLALLAFLAALAATAWLPETAPVVLHAAALERSLPKLTASFTHELAMRQPVRGGSDAGQPAAAAAAVVTVLSAAVGLKVYIRAARQIEHPLGLTKVR